MSNYSLRSQAVINNKKKMADPPDQLDRDCLDITRGLWLISFHAYTLCEHCKFSDKFISFSH